MNLPTLRQLAYLVALVEHRHFGRAAEACHVTQSTLSAGIQELESLLGTTLVERTKRRVLPTPIGLEAAERARRTLAEAEGLVEAVRAAGRPLCGPLRLGIIPTIGPFLLPRVLPSLRARYPELKPYLREDQTARLLAALGAGELDVAILAYPIEAPGTEVAMIRDDAFWLALPPGHPLARLDRIPLRQVPDAELLLLEDGHCLRDHALAACRLEGSKRLEGFRGTSLDTLVQMVAAGLGCTLVPEIALEAGAFAGTNVVMRPLEAGAARRGIGLCWRATSGRGAEFRALAEALADALPVSGTPPGSTGTAAG